MLSGERSNLLTLMLLLWKLSIKDKKYENKLSCPRLDVNTLRKMTGPPSCKRIIPYN